MESSKVLVEETMTYWLKRHHIHIEIAIALLWSAVTLIKFFI